MREYVKTKLNSVTAPPVPPTDWTATYIQLDPYGLTGLLDQLRYKPAYISSDNVFGLKQTKHIQEKNKKNKTGQGKFILLFSNLG